MTETWFLDLDGVRSGPYQTSEVMSLIAEGEVLPHHRISTQLKDAPWKTILDWRLNHSTTPPPAVEKTPTPAPTPVASAPVAPLVIETPAQVTSAEASNAIHLDQLFEAREAALKPASTPTLVPTPAPESAVIPASNHENTGAAKPKRDPTAEMFDLLQSSKQKREAKTQKSGGNENSLSLLPVAPIKRSAFSWVKTGIIGIAIIFFGFLLGQMFQEATPPPPETKEVVNPTKPSPIPTNTPVEIIDRSTDKMIIRSKVEKPNHPHDEVKVQNNNSDTPAKKISDREMEEIRDLKKELQELKALKEEIRNTPTTDGSDSGEGDLDIDPNAVQNPFPPTNKAPNNRDPEALRN